MTIHIKHRATNPKRTGNANVTAETPSRFVRKALKVCAQPHVGVIAVEITLVSCVEFMAKAKRGYTLSGVE